MGVEDGNQRWVLTLTVEGNRGRVRYNGNVPALRVLQALGLAVLEISAAVSRAQVPAEAVAPAKSMDYRPAPVA